MRGVALILPLLFISLNADSVRQFKDWWSNLESLVDETSADLCGTDNISSRSDDEGEDADVGKMYLVANVPCSVDGSRPLYV